MYRWIALGAIFICVAAIATWMTIETQNNRLVWDHFDVVKPTVLYRSGQLNPDQLKQALHRYGIKTVVNFQVAGEGVEAERRIVRKLGVDFVNMPMPGSGFGREEQFRDFLKIVDDPDRRPVLIHCARGTCRTGAAVALFRLERDGWTVDDVDAEMRRQGYPRGWIAGYMLQMVKNRPFEDLYTPLKTEDRNAVKIAERGAADVD
jgi:protein tyrosine/serine phosphatase